MPKSTLPLLDKISRGRYDLIGWDKITEEELKENIKAYPRLLKDLIINDKYGGMTSKLFKFALRQNSNGKDKLIHFAARKGKLSNIPSDFLTLDLLSTPGNGGQSVFHIVAKLPYAPSLDSNLLTKKSILLRDDSGSTPLHSMIMSDCDIVFKQNLSIEDLFIKIEDNETPLYNWATGIEWVKIPDKFLTKETLGPIENGPAAILDVLIAQHKFEISTNTKINTNHSLKNIFRKIDDKDLKKLSSDKEPIIKNIAKTEVARRHLTMTISKTKGCLETL
jgi:ankyrin repeat protein